jgi:hypothetical protein
MTTDSNLLVCKVGNLDTCQFIGHVDSFCIARQPPESKGTEDRLANFPRLGLGTTSSVPGRIKFLPASLIAIVAPGPLLDAP